MNITNREDFIASVPEDSKIGLGILLPSGNIYWLPGTWPKWLYAKHPHRYDFVIVI